MLKSVLNCSHGAYKAKKNMVGGLRMSAQPKKAKFSANLLKQRINSTRNVFVKGSSSTVSLSLDRDLIVPSDGFSSIEDALLGLSKGNFVVVVDDENRENEGDLIINGDKMTTEKMAFMIEYTSGVVCMAMEAPDLKRIDLPLMLNSKENFESMYTAFTITVDADQGTTTGISASDRAITIKKMSDPNTSPSDFRRPGHIFPLRYKEGGVLIRPGHTEAGVDLAKLSGSFPGSALCEIVNRRDGSMARTAELLAFSKEFGFHCITIADLIRYRLRKETLVTPVPSSSSDASSSSYSKLMNTPFGTASVTIFRSKFFKAQGSSQNPSEHVALVLGDVSSTPNPYVIIRVGNPLSDIFDLNGGAGALSRFGSILNTASKESGKPAAAVILYLSASGSSLPSESDDLDQDLELAMKLQTSGKAGKRAADMIGDLANGSSVAGYLGLKSAAEAHQILGILGVKAANIPSVGKTASEKGREARLRKALECCGLKIVN